MNQSRLRPALVVGVPYVLALAANLLVFALLGDRLPDPLASHFDLGGGANGFMGPTGVLLLDAVLCLGLGALFAHEALRGELTSRGLRRLASGGWAGAAFIGFFTIEVLFANRDAVNSSDVRLPPWHFAIGAGVALLAAGVGLMLSRLVPAPGSVPPAPSGTGPRIDLAPGEVASWSKNIGSGALVAAGLLVVYAAALAGVARNWTAGIALLIVGLVLLAFASAHVKVDRRGLTVAAGLAPWPVLRVPLKNIAAADSRNISPLADYGGWGYRFRPGRSGLVLRSGEAIVLRRTNGREFAVTVGDSVTGAGLLNTLIEQQRGH